MGDEVLCEGCRARAAAWRESAAEVRRLGEAMRALHARLLKLEGLGDPEEDTGAELRLTDGTLIAKRRAYSSQRRLAHSWRAADALREAGSDARWEAFKRKTGWKPGG